MENSKKKLLIVGAGFAGLKLFHMVKNHYEVKVLDFKDYFEYTPDITTAVSDHTTYKNLTLSYKDILKSHFVHGGLLRLEDEDSHSGLFKVKNIENIQEWIEHQD